MEVWSQIFSTVAILIFITTPPFLTYWVAFRSKVINTDLKTAQSQLSESSELLESAWLARETQWRVGWALGTLWFLSPMIFAISGANIGEDSFSFYIVLFLVSLTSTLILLIISFIVDDGPNKSIGKDA